MMNSIMETVCKVCVKVRQQTKDGVSFRGLLTLIRREFKQGGVVLKVRTTRDKTLVEEVFYVNGYYDPEDDKEGDCPIELIVTHNFNFNEAWYPIHATLLLTQIFDTVVHELRHQRQHRTRKFEFSFIRGTELEEYLSDPDEIDAYSISIATELVRNLGKDRAIRYLTNPNSLSRLKLHGKFVSPCLGMYIGTFPNSSQTVKRLIKKVYVRLKKVDTDNVFM